MANYTKVNPVGLDLVVDKVQKKLYDKLTALWNVKLDGYPRCYEVKRDKKTTLEHYKGKNEYVSLIHSDTNKFFFTCKKDIVQNSFTTYNAEIEVYFIVNVKDCKPSIQHRADEEVRMDVIDILSNIGYVEVTKKITTDITSVFSGYDFKLVNDLHPNHCFKVTFQVSDFKLK